MPSGEYLTKTNELKYFSLSVGFYSFARGDWVQKKLSFNIKKWKYFFSSLPSVRWMLPFGAREIHQSCFFINNCVASSLMQIFFLKWGLPCLHPGWLIDTARSTSKTILFIQLTFGAADGDPLPAGHPWGVQAFLHTSGNVEKKA